MKSGQSAKFTHSNEMLKHAFWLIISWIQGRDYMIVSGDDLQKLKEKE